MLFGTTETTTIELSDIAAGSGGFVIHGECEEDYSGTSVSSAGDINADGLADLIIGANGADTNGSDSGSSYVVFGTTDTSTIELSDVATGSGGFVIHGETEYDDSGTSVSSAGDVNGDGLADLIIGADRASSYTGSSYVVFGSTSGVFRSGSNFSQIGTASADVITGSSGNDAIAAGAGNDTITGNGGADVLYGGADNDTFVLNSANLHCLAENYGAGNNTDQLARIDGGSGFDTISFSGAGLSFDLRSVANQAALNTSGASRLNSIEAFDLTGSGDNSLTVEISDFHNLARFNSLNSSNAAELGYSSGSYSLSEKESRRQLIINGDDGDQFTVLGAYWSSRGTITKGDDEFRVYHSSTGIEQLIVNQNIDLIL